MINFRSMSRKAKITVFALLFCGLVAVAVFFTPARRALASIFKGNSEEVTFYINSVRTIELKGLNSATAVMLENEFNLGFRELKVHYNGSAERRLIQYPIWSGDKDGNISRLTITYEFLNVHNMDDNPIAGSKTVTLEDLNKTAGTVAAIRTQEEFARAAVRLVTGQVYLDYTGKQPPKRLMLTLN